VHSTCNFRSLSWLRIPFLLIWSVGVLRQSSFTHALIHAKFTSHITSFHGLCGSQLRQVAAEHFLMTYTVVLPSPLLLHTTHSHSHLCIQGGLLHSICQLSHLFLSLLLLNSNEKVHGSIISAVFLGSSNTNSKCSHTHRCIGHYLYI